METSKYFTVIVFLSYIRDITDMLIAAYDEGMFDNGEYAFITIDTNANEDALVNTHDFLLSRFNPCQGYCDEFPNFKEYLKLTYKLVSERSPNL